ncbi:MAG: nucleoside 2-deoxyribosyltransferase domain-containing protein [Pseudomonadota bacterium]
MTKVFLGGTCNGSTWRDALIPMLSIEYFNPVVDDWTPECAAEEARQRMVCDYCLYVLTPKMTGTFAVAEVVDDSNKRPEKTILCVLHEDDGMEFDAHNLKSMAQIEKMVAENGARICANLQDIAALPELQR